MVDFHYSPILNIVRNPLSLNVNVYSNHAAKPTAVHNKDQTAKPTVDPMDQTAKPTSVHADQATKSTADHTATSTADHTDQTATSMADHTKQATKSTTCHTGQTAKSTTRHTGQTAKSTAVHKNHTACKTKISKPATSSTNIPNNQVLTPNQTPGTPSNARPSPIPATCTSTNQDHNYCNPVPPKKRRRNPANLLTKVDDILPKEYQYKCIEFEDLPQKTQDSFRVHFYIKEINCKEEVDNWLSKLATSSNIKYNTESGGRSRTGKRVAFARWYICQCKQKNLTKNQEAAEMRVQQKKQLQSSPNEQRM